MNNDFLLVYEIRNGPFFDEDVGMYGLEMNTSGPEDHDVIDTSFMWFPSEEDAVFFKEEVEESEEPVRRDLSTESVH